MKRILIAVVVLIAGLMVFAACNRGGSHHPVDSRLVGTWFYDGGVGAQISFTAEGTGSRNWWGGIDNFDWGMDGNNLYKDMRSGLVFNNRNYLNYEQWTATFSNNNNTVVFSSRQEAGMIFTYHRLN
ncbi:MAG: hypothetical protein FWB74_06065 [Defluviitaleaceae bacterium]|nr:hypothetical protein [Defluviitaleaceae bacterium]